MVIPLWVEYSLYSDASVVGELQFGPYRLLMDFGFPSRGRIGEPYRCLVLRSYDHLAALAEPEERRVDFTPNLEGWTGGDMGEQFAALLSLALARRIRSSGVSRQCFSDLGDPDGVPVGPDVAPALQRPVSRPMLPTVSNEARVEQAQRLLDIYGRLEAADALALTRAAAQYADALWWADADPRISWIKLVGALETAANRSDFASVDDPVALLKRHRGKLYGQLKRIDARAVEVVAQSLSGLLNAQAKMIAFAMRFPVSPPSRRPTIARFDFDDLESALRVIYHWRSRDLHDGIAIPQPLCEPPIADEHGVAHERMAFLAAQALGGTWDTDEELPMYLHTFAHVVGEILRSWWDALGE